MTNPDSFKWLTRKRLTVGCVAVCTICCLSFALSLTKSPLQRDVEALGGSYDDYNMDFYSGKSPLVAAYQSAWNIAQGIDRQSLSIDLYRSAVSDEWLQSHAEALSDVPLHSLVLNHTQVGDDGLQGLTGAQQLGFLDVKETRVSDECVEELMRLKNLHSLNVIGTNFSEIGIVALTNHSRLRRLSFDGDLLTDAVVSHFNNTPRLKDIELYDPKADALNRVSQLQHVIGLTVNDVDDDLVPQLSQLTNLRFLILYDNRLSADSMQSLKAALPKAVIGAYMSFETAEEMGVYANIEYQQRMIMLSVFVLFVLGALVLMFAVWFWRRWKFSREGIHG